MPYFGVGIEISWTFEKEKIFQRKIDTCSCIEGFKMPPVHGSENPLTPRRLGQLGDYLEQWNSHDALQSPREAWCPPGQIKFRSGDSLVKPISREALLVFVFTYKYFI